jgi:hypothetical protein
MLTPNRYLNLRNLAEDGQYPPFDDNLQEALLEVLEDYGELMISVDNLRAMSSPTEIDGLMDHFDAWREAGLI